MKNSLLVLVIILLVKSNLNAQHISLDGNFEQNLYVSDEEITFTIQVPSAVISGEIQSAVCTTIIPSLNHVIIISNPEGISSINPTGGSKGTVIRPKPRIIDTGGKTTPIKSKLDIRLNQTNNEIQITSQEGLVIGLTLYDLSGKLLFTEKTIPTSNYSITTTQLKNAIYILKIDLDNQQYKTLKLIKN